MIKAPVGVVEGLDITAFDRRVGGGGVRGVVMGGGGVRGLFMECSFQWQLIHPSTPVSP